MASVSVTINGRNFRMACEDGQEDHLRGLAEQFDRRIADARADLGEIGDARLTVVAALLLADEFADCARRMQSLQQELSAAKAFGEAAVARAQTTQQAVIAALNAASERVERVTRGLNDGIAETLPFG